MQVIEVRHQTLTSALFFCFIQFINFQLKTNLRVCVVYNSSFGKYHLPFVFHLCLFKSFKRIFHPKRRIQLLCIYSVNGMSDGFIAQNTVGHSKEKVLLSSPKQFKQLTKIQTLKMKYIPEIVSILFVWSNPSILKPQHDKLFWKSLLVPNFLPHNTL